MDAKWIWLSKFECIAIIIAMPISVTIELWITTVGSVPGELILITSDVVSNQLGWGKLAAGDHIPIVSGHFSG